jgi:hypothetical protein
MQQLVLQREITVNALSDSLNVQNAQIRFQSVTATGRRNRSQGVTGVKDLFDSLRCPQEKRQFSEGKGLRAVGSPAFAVAMAVFKIKCADVLKLVIAHKIKAPGGA